MIVMTVLQCYNSKGFIITVKQPTEYDVLFMYEN